MHSDQSVNIFNFEDASNNYYRPRPFLNSPGGRTDPFGSPGSYTPPPFNPGYTSAEGGAFGQYVGAVFTETNAASGNQVLVYGRNADGSLTAQPLTSVATGGNGTGKGLGNQGAVVLGDNNHLLAAVNAGSNSFSLFRVSGTNLTPLSTIQSGGTDPVSVAINGNNIYVLNQGSDEITQFHLVFGGVVPVASQKLSGTGVAGAEVAVSPDGQNIVVTEKATNKIDLFTLKHGKLSTATTITAGAPTPFGFAFNGNNKIVVSEANGGATSYVESYNIAKGTLTSNGGPVATGENAACWVAISPDGQYAYVADAASSYISGTAIASNGSLTIQSAASVSTGTDTKPLDETVSHDGKALYVIDGKGNSILSYTRGANGSLTSVGTPVSILAGDVGIASI